MSGGTVSVGMLTFGLTLNVSRTCWYAASSAAVTVCTTTTIVTWLPGALATITKFLEPTSEHASNVRR